METVDIDAIVRKAIDLRQRLASEIDENDPARTSATKRRQLAQLREVTANLRKIADGVIGLSAFPWAESRPRPQMRRTKICGSRSGTRSQSTGRGTQHSLTL